jgi:hypothetical protein
MGGFAFHTVETNPSVRSQELIPTSSRTLDEEWDLDANYSEPPHSGIDNEGQI